MDITWQAAESIINVEYNERAKRDHLETGIALLRRAHYAEARHELTKAIEESPGDERGHYYVALALLDGVRPNRRPRAVLDRVRRHLQTAAALPEARVLLLMVDEDDGLSWRYHTHVPQALFDLVALLEDVDIEELLTHVPAHGTRTYRVMEMALTGDEPNRS
jgi:hypothetical protein